MRKIFNLLCVVLSILSCTQTQQSSYQKDNSLPKKTEIAIVLPISVNGDAKALKLNELINMGLRDGAARNLNITTYDTFEQANIPAIMEKIVAAKTDLIIGPISSAETRQIAMIAKANNIVTISLSNDPSIADFDLYIFGHAPLQQTKRLIQYLSSTNVENMILLLPENVQSDSLIKIISDIAQKNQINLVRIEKYSPELESINSKVQNISYLVDSLNENPENKSKVAVYIADQ